MNQPEPKPDAQAEVGLREKVALIEQRLANCSILHSQDNSNAKWIDGVCITPTLAVQEIMALHEADKAAAVVEALERLLQYNGAYIGIDGRRVENMVDHQVIKADITRLQPPTAGEGESGEAA